MANATVHELLSARAVEAPAAPFIVAEGREPLSYGALWEQARRVQETLSDCGIGRRDRVAMVLPSGPEMAACVATVSASVAVAPLNPEFTENEFDYFFSALDTKALIALSGQESPARAAADRLGMAVLELRPGRQEPAGTFRLSGGSKGPADGSGPGREDDPALLLTTSGTTSRGKIVPITHARLIACAGNSTRLYGLGAEDRCLNLMPLFHAHGLYCGLFAPIVSGGSTICLPRFDAESFFRCLGRLKPTWYTGAYTFHHAVLNHAARHADAIAEGRIRFIRSGSGRLDPAIAAGLEEAFGVPVIETYATTETGTICGNPLSFAERKLGTVGRPFAGELGLMDGTGRIVPGGEAQPGEAGEIVVRGPSVFDGYENDAEANAAAFLDGWFRTGDRGSFDAGGYLTIESRMKEIINRGGEKIAPHEIDTVLMRHADVALATTFATPHPTLGEEVAAAIVPRPGAAPTDRDLGDFARRHLAAFKVPRRFVFVDAIPTGPTGKIKRAELAAAFGLDAPAKREGKSTPGSAARDDLERVLVDLLEDLLRVTSIGCDDDIIALGADSLTAVELAIAVEKKTGIALPIEAIWSRATTVAELASLARNVRDDAAAAPPPPAPVPVPGVGYRTPVPLINLRDLVEPLVLLVLSTADRLGRRRHRRETMRALAGLSLMVRPWRARERERTIRRVLGARRNDISPRALSREILANLHEHRLLRLEGWARKNVSPPVVLEGAEHLDRALRRGKGIILWRAPLTFDVLAVTLALNAAGYPVSILGRPEHGLSKTRFGHLLLNRLSRESEGPLQAEVIRITGDGQHAIAQVRRRLAENRIVSINANFQTDRPVELCFLDGRIELATGPPRLALATGAALIPAFTAREEDGRFRVVVEPPLEAEDESDPVAATQALMQRFVVALEARVLRDPATWPNWHENVV